MKREVVVISKLKNPIERMQRSSGSRGRTAPSKITAQLAEKRAGTGRSDQLVIGIQRDAPQILSCNRANHGIAQITVHLKEALGAAPFSKLESGRTAGPLGRNVKRDALTRGVIAHVQSAAP